MPKSKSGEKSKRVTWKCTGIYNGSWCNYIITDLEMQLHKFDVGCPRCGCDFADFTCVIEDS